MYQHNKVSDSKCTTSGGGLA